MAGVNALAEAFNTVNNYTQDPANCNFLSANNSDTHRIIGPDEFAWNFSICSELPWAISFVYDFYKEEYDQNCLKTYGL